MPAQPQEPQQHSRGVPLRGTGIPSPSDLRVRGVYHPVGNDGRDISCREPRDTMATCHESTKTRQGLHAAETETLCRGCTGIGVRVLSGSGREPIGLSCNRGESNRLTIQIRIRILSWVIPGLKKRSLVYPGPEWRCLHLQARSGRDMWGRAFTPSVRRPG